MSLVFFGGFDILPATMQSPDLPEHGSGLALDEPGS